MSSTLVAPRQNGRAARAEAQRGSPPAGLFGEEVLQALRELAEVQRQLAEGQLRIEAALASGGGRPEKEQGGDDGAAAKEGEQEGGGEQDASERSEWRTRGECALEASTVSRQTNGDPNILASVPGFLAQIEALAPRDAGAAGFSITCSYSQFRLARSAAGTQEMGGWRCILHPYAKARLLWDLVAVLLLLYDSVEVPLLLAWDREVDASVWLATNLFSFTFWALDLVLGFSRGYQDREGGLIVMDRKRIVRNYLRRGFFPNLLALCADSVAMLIWTMHTGEGGPFPNAVSFVLRFLRMYRVVRLLSLLKTGRLSVAHDILERLEFDVRLDKKHTFTRVFLIISKFSLISVWLLHLLACSWQAIGKDSKDAFYLENGLQAQQGDLLYDYALTLYAASSSLIAFESIFMPSNPVELFTIVLVTLLGVIWSSVFVGVISDAMAASRALASERQHRLKVLRKFLMQSRASPGLAVSIETEVTRAKHSDRILESDVDLLQVLSPHLRKRLQATILAPAVGTQTFIRACDSLSPNLVHHLIMEAGVEQLVFGPGEFVLKKGGVAEGAYFVNWGTFEYSRPRYSASEHVMTVKRETLDVCTWAFELALFCKWSCCGSVLSLSSGEVFRLDSAKLVDVFQADPELSDIFQDYARGLCRALQSHPDSMTSELVLPVGHEEVLAILPQSTRSALSKAGLRLVEERSEAGLHLKAWRSRAHEQLREEVQRGECDLVVMRSLKTWDSEPEENVLRVVSLVALRLRTEDDCLLVQLGKLGSHGVVAEVTMPGSKMHETELPSDALHRLVSERLGPVDDIFSLTGRRLDVDVHFSKGKGILTKYNRNIMDAAIEEGWQARCGVCCLEWGSRLEESPPPCCADEIRAAFVTDTDAGSHDRALIFTLMDTNKFERLRQDGEFRALEEWLGAQVPNRRSDT